MFKKKLITYFIFAGISINLFAQGDLTLYQLRNLNQSSSLNPAFFSDYNTSLGLPVFSGIAVGVQLSGFDLNTVFNSRTSDSLVNLGNFYSAINSKFFGAKLFQQTDLFHFRQQFGHYQIGLNIGTKTNCNALISKEFIGFAANGNAAFAGQNMSFDGNDIQVSSYVETGLSVAREFERFTVGARVKLLNGIANVSSSGFAMNYQTGAISTDPTIVTLGGTMNSCGLPYLQDSINGVKNQDSTFNFSNIKPFSNVGVAFDFGATYRVSPRFNIHASVIDLGSIKWTSHVYNYNLNSVNITYAGLSYNQFNDSATKQQYTDSLKNLIRTKSSNNAYSTPLTTKIIFGAEYDVTFRDRLGLLIQFQYFSGTFFPSYTFSYNRKVGTNWDIAANYSYYNNSFSNLGIGTSVKWGAFQMYIIQDDILMYINPNDMRTAYLRFGCNMVWGQHRPRPRF